jgi:hypothetical protein
MFEFLKHHDNLFGIQLGIQTRPKRLKTGLEIEWLSKRRPILSFAGLLIHSSEIKCQPKTVPVDVWTTSDNLKIRPSSIWILTVHQKNINYESLSTLPRFFLVYLFIREKGVNLNTRGGQFKTLKN